MTHLKTNGPLISSSDKQWQSCQDPKRGAERLLKPPEAGWREYHELPAGRSPLLPIFLHQDSILEAESGSSSHERRSVKGWIDATRVQRAQWPHNPGKAQSRMKV